MFSTSLHHFFYRSGVVKCINLCIDKRVRYGKSTYFKDLDLELDAITGYGIWLFLNKWCIFIVKETVTLGGDFFILYIWEEGMLSS